MVEFFDEHQERFFNWTDKIIQDYIKREQAVFKWWRPRKNPDGSYDLVFKLAVRKEAVTKFAVPVPAEFHELLEREYFINHPPEEEEES